MYNHTTNHKKASNTEIQTYPGVLLTEMDESDPSAAGTNLVITLLFNLGWFALSAEKADDTGKVSWVFPSSSLFLGSHI